MVELIIVSCLARNRVHTTDMIREAWTVIVVLHLPATANGPGVLGVIMVKCQLFFSKSRTPNLYRCDTLKHSF